MTKFKPNYLLDEQMLFSDAKTALAHQIREELKETNRLLRKLVEQKEGTSSEKAAEPQAPSADSDTAPVSDGTEQQESEPPSPADEEKPVKVTKSKAKK